MTVYAGPARRGAAPAAVHHAGVLFGGDSGGLVEGDLLGAGCGISFVVEHRLDRGGDVLELLEGSIRCHWVVVGGSAAVCKRCVRALGADDVAPAFLASSTGLSWGWWGL